MNQANEYDQAPLKQRELQHCVVCGKGVMHDGHPFFYRIRIAHMGVRLDSMRQQHGLEMMLGAAAPLAGIMGPDPDMAESLDGKGVEVTLCQPCAMETTVCELPELGQEAIEKEKAEDDS